MKLKFCHTWVYHLAMLYARRKRLKELADAEARGESFWSAQFDERARWKLVHSFNDACSEHLREGYAELVRGLILRDEGLPYLSLSSRNATNLADLMSYLLNCGDEMVPSTIEAMARALASFPHGLGGMAGRGDVNDFTTMVNTVLREHRISYELVAMEMIPFSSRELHAEVVGPVLRLLSGRSGWEKVESAYQDALAELSEGKPADAITDVGTALQEALVMLGCKGNALGPLARSARSKGLLAPHDPVMTDVVEKLIDWVSADRSSLGDAHRVVEVTTEDAWFTVHVVGALILRLAGSRRSKV